MWRAFIGIFLWVSECGWVIPSLLKFLERECPATVEVFIRCVEEAGFLKQIWRIFYDNYAILLLIHGFLKQI